MSWARPWLPAAEPLASHSSLSSAYGEEADAPRPSPLCSPSGEVTLCPPLGLSLSEAEGIWQRSTRTRRPSDDQVGLRWWSVLCPWVEGCGVPPLPPASPHMLPPHSSPVSRVVYNGKRNSSPRSPPNSSEIFTPAHEENVRFIYEGSLGAPRSPPPACPGWELHLTLPSPQGPGAGVTQGPCLVKTGSGNGVVHTVLFLLGSTPEGAAPQKRQHLELVGFLGGRGIAMEDRWCTPGGTQECPRSGWLCAGRWGMEEAGKAGATGRRSCVPQWVHVPLATALVSTGGGVVRRAP